MNCSDVKCVAQMVRDMPDVYRSCAVVQLHRVDWQSYSLLLELVGRFEIVVSMSYKLWFLANHQPPTQRLFFPVLCYLSIVHMHAT